MEICIRAVFEEMSKVVSNFHFSEGKWAHTDKVNDLKVYVLLLQKT